MSIEVQDIIDNYNQRNNQRLRASPILLYVMMNAKNIQKVNSAERRIMLKDSWEKIDFQTKSKYNEASMLLGYKGLNNSGLIVNRIGNLADKLKKLESLKII